jgi:hypothetical protein
MVYSWEFGHGFSLSIGAIRPPPATHLDGLGALVVESGSDREKDQQRTGERGFGPCFS